jgi:hypothetical protein
MNPSGQGFFAGPTTKEVKMTADFGLSREELRFEPSFASMLAQEYSVATRQRT